MNSKIDDCHMKAMKTIFFLFGWEGSGNPESCARMWMMKLTTTDCSSRKTFSGRKVSKGDDKSWVYTTSNNCHLQEPCINLFDGKMIRHENYIHKVMNAHLGCEGQMTPKHISPGFEHVLAGVSVVEAVQEQ